jgi:beta-lactamase class A
MHKHLRIVKPWFTNNRRQIIRSGVVVVGLLLIVQLLYPGSKLLPFVQVDGVAVGGWDKKDAIWQLNYISKNQPIELSLGKSSGSYDTPKPGEVGIEVAHDEQVKSLQYPWYLRIVPSSLLWFGAIQAEREPNFMFDNAVAKEYLTKKIGKNCVIPAKNATLRVDGEALEVVPATSGGTCQEEQAVAAISSLRPRPNDPVRLVVPVTVIAPMVGNDSAEQLAEKLHETTKDGITLSVAGKTFDINQSEVLGWLTFPVTAAGINFSIDSNKAGQYLAKTATPLVAKPAGVTKITTVDFTETARNDGSAGQTLNLSATVADISRVLRGEKDQASAAVAPLAPKVEYSRSYTKTSTGIAAQMKHYDDDNAGVFGVSLIELGGNNAKAQHNGDRQFVTASTYKLFVAFSTIKRVEAGDMKWGDANIAGGRSLSQCFDDMIVNSDNPCAEALIKKIGAKGLNADIASLGLGSSGFKSDNNVTTANDLASYLRQLESGSMPIKSDNRSRLLNAMKRNVYRQGVPAGASGQVADKVGFLWGLLHDATIVYSPTGTYVLVVLTDGSSWANIADLTRKIEALRSS